MVMRIDVSRMVRSPADSGDSVAAPPEQQGMPRLPGANEGELYGLGIDALAATLVSKTAEAAQKIAREVRRAEKETQIAELRQQVSSLREKANATRTEGWVQGSMTVAGGAMAFGASTNVGGDGKLNAIGDRWVNAGKATQDLGGAIAKAGPGASSVHHDADATSHAAAAKHAEQAADDWGALEKQSGQVIDKAIATLQKLVEERAVQQRMLLRAG